MATVILERRMPDMICSSSVQHGTQALQCATVAGPQLEAADILLKDGEHHDDVAELAGLDSRSGCVAGGDTVGPSASAPRRVGVHAGSLKRPLLEVATGASGFDRRVTMRGDTDPTARAASGTNLEAGYSDSEHDS